MSAPLVHGEFTFPGIHQDLIFPTSENRRQLNEIFSVNGATKISGGKGVREITCEHWLFDSYANNAQLNAKLRDINDHTGEVGTLVDSLGTTFTDVEFIRQEPVQGPLYDPEKGAWKKIRLIFEELVP